MSMIKREALVARMLAYDGHFDGYPSMSCTDETLIEEAVQEVGEPYNVVALLCYLASVYVTTEKEYQRARDFINDYVQTWWTCNMQEGNNPVQDQIDREETNQP